VIEGPFVNFQGAIDDLSPERGKLKVMVAIFGRMTPVELEYYQVERL
jgi:transcriptional antiterminator NusG